MASSSSVPALLHMRNVVDGQRRIYLVENNVNFAEYLTCIFKLAGYYIDLVAKEHVTSLKWIDQVSLAPPDLVVLNIGMFSEPERFLLQIRARIMSEEMTWFPPILLFTTYQSDTPHALKGRRLLPHLRSRLIEK